MAILVTAIAAIVGTIFSLLLGLLLKVVFELKKDTTESFNKLRDEIKELSNKKADKTDMEALEECARLKATKEELGKVETNNGRAHVDIWTRVHGHKHDSDGHVVILPTTGGAV